MKPHVLVCSLIFTVGLLAGVGSLLNRLKGNNVTIDNGMDALATRLSVYDDDYNLIGINLEDDEEFTSIVIADNVKFYLYTRKNPDIYQELLLDNSEVVTLSNFNHEKPTCFVTHGWVTSYKNPLLSSVREAYLKKDDVNVIAVDFSKIAFERYVWASRQIPEIGQQLAKMIDFLKGHKLDLAKTTLVGPSLGAHVMGIAGYYVNGTVGNVVGLDPALPFFAQAKPGSRISTEDATYVQIIHTNAGMAGYADAIGHVDFYPNGGSLQPGCLGEGVEACSHIRALKLFTESINSELGFHAKPCNTFLEFISGKCNTDFTVIMGGSPLQIAPLGKYYLLTNSETPYAKGIES